METHEKLKIAKGRWEKYPWKNETESQMLQTIGLLVELAEQQQDEIKDLKQMFKGRGRKIIKLQNELKEQSIFYENLLQD